MSPNSSSLTIFSYLIAMGKSGININADLGEMAGQDELLMPYLHSCNIATGGHVGDSTSMRKTIRLAQQHHVKIGAHPSYPDVDHFGRIRPNIREEALKESLKQQLYTFYEIANELDAQVHHIKPHGALYHDVANNKRNAELFLTVLEEIGVKTSIYTLKNGFLHQMGQKKHKVYFEAFIDRRYTSDLNLVNRRKEHALIMKPEAVWQQLKSIYFEEKVNVESGEVVEINADTYCIHGDHPNALEILQHIDVKMKEEK